MLGSGGISNSSMSHFAGADLTLRFRLRHHRPGGQHASQRFNSVVFWRRGGARHTSQLGLIHDRAEPAESPAMSAMPPHKAEVNSEKYCPRLFRVDGEARDMISSSQTAVCTEN
jgi:hypothetical protein